MNPEAKCWNYIVKTEPIMFSVIKGFLFEKGGLSLVEQSAELLYNEVSKNSTKNLSYNLFKKYFEPTVKIEYTYTITPLVKRVNWSKLKMPKLGMPDGIIKHLNKTQ